MTLIERPQFNFPNRKDEKSPKLDPFVREEGRLPHGIMDTVSLNLRVNWIGRRSWLAGRSMRRTPRSGRR